MIYSNVMIPRKIAFPSITLLSIFAFAAICLIWQSPARATTPHTYYFPWYDNNSAWGMNGDWLLVANQGSNPTGVEIFLGDSLTPAATYTLSAAGSAGDHAAWQSPAVITDGPVRVVSTAGEPLGVSQRVLYESSFNEMRAIDQFEVETEYYFTWYDNSGASGMNGNWICAANLGSESTYINIYIGDVSDVATPVATLGPLPAGGHTEWQSPTALISGPVRVSSTGGQPIIASQRVLYKESFNEVAGIGATRLGQNAMFAWYDHSTSNGMTGNWILVSNRDDNGFDAARVQISIAGTPMHDPANPEHNYFIIPPGGYVTPQFDSIMGGPVSVVCQNCDAGQKLIVSQRVIYKNSFEEVQGASPQDLSELFSYPIPVPGSGETVQGTPPNDMGDSGFMNWYDSTAANGMMGDWVLVGNNSGAAVNVTIAIGGVNMTNPATGTTTFPVAARSVITPAFNNLMDGPVKVTCLNCAPEQKLIISQRTLYQNSFNEVVARPTA